MIRKKILITNIVMASIVIITAGYSFWAVTNLFGIIEDGAKASEVLHNEDNVDMMHDGIRADVLMALHGAVTNDTELLKQAQSDVDEHTKIISDSMEANKKIFVSNEISKAIEEAGPDLEAYKASAKDIIATAAVNAAEANAKFPKFVEKFSALEEKLGTLGDSIVNHIKTRSDEVSKEETMIITILLALCGSMLLITLTTSRNTFAWLIRPLAKVVEVMQKLSSGDNTVTIPYVEKQDEMGDMARTLEVFKNNAMKVQELAANEEKQRTTAIANKKAEMHKLAAEFESGVKSIVDIVASASTEMNATSGNVVNIVNQSNIKLGDVSTELQQAVSNVQTVAAATNQFTASISDISTQINRASTIAANAVTETKNAESMATDLATASEKIGNVVTLISNIAAQINLLALNATIESARAGEAGKGFAVVAQEVKNLAGQTSKATEEILSYVSAIQTSTSNTVGAIQTITSVINELNHISSTVAAAVEEQSSVTEDISRNITEVSSVTNHISESMEDVSRGSRETGRAAEETLAATGELSKQAEKLRSEVDKFLVGIRNA